MRYLTKQILEELATRPNEKVREGAKKLLELLEEEKTPEATPEKYRELIKGYTQAPRC